MLNFISPEYFLIALFTGLLALAAVHDVAQFRIPNRISLAIVALYPVYVLASSTSVDWTGGLMTGAAALAVGMVLFATRTMGGGDVKLIAATALWAGPTLIFDFVAVTALTGGILSVILLTPFRFSLAMALETVGGNDLKQTVLGSVLPYGVAISAGGCVVSIGLLGRM